MKPSTAALIALSPFALSVSIARAQDADRITRQQLDHTSFCAIGRKPPCTINTAVARGLFETGLHPRFADGVKCRAIDSEKYAIDYTYKRNRPSRHGGIDMPAPFGTPIYAAAAGTVVGVYRGSGKGHQGVHVILRHTPQDTGLPIWVYTVYAHLNKMPKLHVGEHLKMGDLIGPTGNSGASGAHKGGRRGGAGAAAVVKKAAADATSLANAVVAATVVATSGSAAPTEAEAQVVAAATTASGGRRSTSASIIAQGRNTQP